MVTLKAVAFRKEKQMIEDAAVNIAGAGKVIDEIESPRYEIREKLP